MMTTAKTREVRKKRKFEFMLLDDLANACVFMMEKGIGDGPYNVGTGTDVTIRELARTVMDIVGFSGEIAVDATKPDGTPRKFLDVQRLASVGWTAHTELKTGMQIAYADFAKSA